MPQFLLLLRGDVTQDYSDLTPDDMQRIIESYDQWAGKLAEQGLLLGGQKLTDGAGKVLQPGADGSVGVKDGPYVETKEAIGGYYVIKAESYDHAQELCAEHPNYQFGSIEIREIELTDERGAG